MIDRYSFGKIVINGQQYNKDLLIDNGEILPEWWREKGHLLQLADLRKVLNELPDIVIIGTGKYGMMQISKEVTAYFRENGIATHFYKTDKAVDLYNELKNTDKRLVAGLHLTC